MIKLLDTFKNVLKEEAQAITDASRKINQDQIDTLVKIYQRLIESNGNLVFTGVGKSGIIAQKISSTFCSLGFPSFFMHPVEAIHGDLGRISNKDGIVYFSKSGTTEELIKLQKYINISKLNSIAIVGNIHTDLANSCSLVFDSSIKKEACINDLAPTTSTTLSLSIGDAMSVVFEKFINLSPESFAINHPGGFIGKSLKLKVEDIMIPINSCPTLSLKNTLRDAIVKMTEFPVGICSVLDEKLNLLGIMVDGDFRRILKEEKINFDNDINQYINHTPVIIQGNKLAYDGLELMQKRSSPISALPVLDSDNKFIGIIRLHDLLKEGFILK
jgi:arabinose-5-phosphate isomerase